MTKIVVDDSANDEIVVTCYPFEPDEDHPHDRYVGIFYNGVEESFVVLDGQQAAQLAALLINSEFTIND